MAWSREAGRTLQTLDGAIANGLWTTALLWGPAGGSTMQLGWGQASHPILFTLYRLPACHPHTHFI